MEKIQIRQQFSLMENNSDLLNFEKKIENLLFQISRPIPIKSAVQYN
jgi:hypothetical protein